MTDLLSVERRLVGTSFFGFKNKLISLVKVRNDYEIKTGTRATKRKNFNN